MLPFCSCRHKELLMLRHSAGAVLLAIALASPALAQQPPADPQKPAAPADQKPATQPAPETQQTPEESPVYKEQVVVTASKTEQALVNAPATVSLISNQTIVAMRWKCVIIGCITSRLCGGLVITASMSP